MALINLTTNLKSLKFGNDQPGGGSSNQPYIQADIPNQLSPLNGGADSDFLLRGGITAPLTAARDVLRLSKFFIDTKSPNGLFFTLKQNLLSRTSVRTQASTGPSYGGANGGVNQGIYTPIGTLAQAGVGFTGTHLNLLGLDPSSPMSGVVNRGLFPNLGLNRYGERVNFNQETDENRLVGLYQAKTLQDPTFIPKGLKGSYAVSNDIVLSYGGGPNSILGIGKTNIYFSDQRTGLNNPKVNPPFSTIFTVEQDGDSTIIRTDYTNFNTPSRVKINYKKILGVLGASGYYSAFTETFPIENNITPNGDLTRYDSVYKEDSLDPNPFKFGKSSWTPSFQDPIGPNSPTTYLEDLALTGSTLFPDLSIKPNVLVGGVIELNSVYESGSLERNTTSDRKFGKSSWTPSFQSKVNYTGSLGASKEYQSYLDPGFDPLEANDITENGDLLSNPSVYIPDLLVPDLYNGKFGDSSWTPSDQDRIGPNSPINYLPSLAETGSLSTITFDTNVLANGIQDLNSVYKSGSLVSIDNKISENNTKVLTQTQISDIRPNTSNKNNTGAPSIMDFRKSITTKGSDGTPYNVSFTAPDYSTKNIEQRLFLGDPGIKGYVGSYEGGKSDDAGSPLGPLDKLNHQSLYSSTGPDDTKPINDLVKFRIASLDSGGGSSKVYMHFRAFLDSFQDSYNAEWQAQKYLGRGENFYSYNGFDRKISLSWTVMAQSKEELIPMYKKLDYLASNLAPDYSVNGYMRGPLVSLTIGGYLYEQPGFITSLTYDIPMECTWEIGINDEGGSDSSVKELPHMIKVTGFSFTPIHTFVPRKGDLNSLGSIPFIALRAGEGSNY